ncbi:MAG: tetratricopeptide repeat protein [bacterium]|nr:tetratricopeptide repeat protein [bacterium]
MKKLICIKILRKLKQLKFLITTIRKSFIKRIKSWDKVDTNTLVTILGIILTIGAMFFATNDSRKASKEMSLFLKNFQKNGEELLTNMRENIGEISDITKPLLEKDKKELDEYVKATNFFEAFGISLKPEDYYSRGVDFSYKQQYNLALTAFTKAIELNPNYADAFYNRGVIYGKKGELEKAIKNFDKAISINPNFADAFYGRGNVYGDKRELEKAIQDYDKAITIKPNFSEAFNNRGCAYDDKGESEKAIQDFDRAISININNENAFNNRGNIYFHKGELEKAMEDYAKAISINPNYVKAMRNMGMLYKLKGNKEKARFWLNEALIKKEFLTDKEEEEIKECLKEVGE